MGGLLFMIQMVVFGNLSPSFQWLSTLVRCSREPELRNECESGQNYVIDVFWPGFPRLLVSPRQQGATGGLQIFGAFPQRQQ